MKRRLFIRLDLTVCLQQLFSPIRKKNSRRAFPTFLGTHRKTLIKGLCLKSIFFGNFLNGFVPKRDSSFFFKYQNSDFGVFKYLSLSFFLTNQARATIVVVSGTRHMVVFVIFFFFAKPPPFLGYENCASFE